MVLTAPSYIQTRGKTLLPFLRPHVFWTSSIPRCFFMREASNLPVGTAGVSSHGRILNKRGVVSWGSRNAAGYCVTCIGGSFKYVHRIVAHAFLGPPPSETMNEINHIDGNPSNNMVNNLEYATRAQNVQHSFMTNTSRKSGADSLSKPVLGKHVEAAAWQLFPSIRGAARHVTCSPSSIARRCEGLTKSIGGFEFCYADCQPSVIPGEEWRVALNPLQGTQLSTWMVSSHGRVKSSRNIISLGSLKSSGYRVIGASCDGARRNFYVHRLVARAFLGPIPSFDRCVVHHKDSDPGNNCADNLEYVTQGYNVWHSWHTGSRGKTRATCKPVWARHLASESWVWYPSMKDASLQLELIPSSIASCCSGTLKRTGEYEFILAEQPDLRILPGEE